MVSFRSVGTAVTALALAVSVPVTSVSASVRPGSAVPVVSQNYETGSVYKAQATSMWGLYVVMALIAAGTVWIVLKDHDGEINLPISRG